jgi:uncharacterized ferritin-like protein (DUF455 family)
MWAFNVENVNEKINLLRRQETQILEQKKRVQMPKLPARDVLVLDFKSHPAKKGFSTSEGQARMLHDLASIELQAMELGLRTLLEFPDADPQFRDDLWRLTVSESEHLEMCLNEIQAMGFKWGDWPVNCGLWTAVSDQDSLIDRVLIVHRYLEGSGLDAGDTLLRRLAGVDAKCVQKALKIINDEEVGHVMFGSSWYRKFCLVESLNPETDFTSRMDKLRGVLPKRIGQINHELRRRAGFNENEIFYLERLRESFLEKESVWKV